MVLFLLPSLVKSQCTIANYLTAFRIPATSYPYISVSSGVTVSVTIVNISTLSDVAYACNGNNYAGASPAWWLNSTTQRIVLNFSAPVTRFTVLANGINATEIFYYAAATGAITLADYCTTGMIPSGSQISYTPTAAGGSLISIVNPTGSTSYTMTHNGLGSGSRVTLLDCFLKLAPLPVELTEFKAQCRSTDVVELQWQTASELENDFFSVEKSADTKNWMELGNVKGAGTFMSVKNYSYRDNNKNSGTVYYRLKQTDVNRNYKYSDMVVLNSCQEKGNGELILYPNPAKSEVIFKTDADGVMVEITDLIGFKLEALSLERGENKVNLSNYANGTYYIKVINENGEVNIKKLLIDN